MGAGSSHEAEFTLLGPVPAGTWTLVADGIITQSVDVTFELILRRDGADQLLTSWMQHFDPRGGGNFDAVIYEETASVAAIEWVANDELVLRYTGVNSANSMAYVPNGEGATANGRIPHLILP